MMKTLGSTETSVTIHQSTGRNLHQHLCENVLSHTRPCRAELLCMTRLLRMCGIIAPFTKAPHCTILQSMYYSYYM
jgi:hypothetical protein